ncbi:guanine deaminase [Bradyrhizobium sp.]|uniref:guanine deaminase n=1 Tax=Bradyrhizobium sp. TaxID=376 RepID=UPI003C272B85
MDHLGGKAIIASGFHMIERGSVEILRNALIAIGEDGAIVSVLRPDERGYEEQKSRQKAMGMLVTLPQGAYLLPGFVDLHVHAPQYPQLGSALDVPLEVWLQQYTFPLEARYADAAFARRSYGLLVRDLVANGTTTALYFATIHQEATRILADICLEAGQRAVIGKVAMDNAEQCPDYYRDASPDQAIRGTEDLIGYIRSHKANSAALVKPVVTPRFIPSCTDATLEGLGALARQCGCHVQTHCSESDWEHGYVLARHGITDTDSLDRFGLLGRHTVLAHSTLITAEDMATIGARGSGIAHCPLSNAYFSSAVFPLKAALDKGIHVGLGSDISGGPSGSLFDNMRSALMVARMLELGVDPKLGPSERSRHAGARIDFRDAFYCATTGGGVALDLPVGKFSPGYQFDAMVIDTTDERGTIRLWDDLDQGETVLQKIIYTASKPNIAKVWVGGRQVS